MLRDGCKPGSNEGRRERPERLVAGGLIRMVLSILVVVVVCDLARRSRWSG